MATLPTVPTFTAGEDPTAAKMNALATAVSFLYDDRPLAVVCRSSSTQSMASGAEVSFDTVLKDNDDMVDLGTNATRITIKTAGLYLLVMAVPYTDAAGGSPAFRTWRIKKNGSTEINGDVQPLFGATAQIVANAVTVSSLAVNDYLEIETEHNASSNLVTRTANDGPKLSALWLMS